MHHDKTLRFSKRLSGVMRIDPPVAPPPEPEPLPEPVPAPETIQEINLDAAILDQCFAQLQSKAASWHHDLNAKTAEIQQFALELAVLMAERLVMEKIHRGELAIEKIVDQAMRRLHPKKPVSVRLHPEDRALLEKRTALSERMSVFPDLQLIDDPQLQRGDCKLQAEDVGIWSNWRRGLDLMRASLFQGLPASK